MLNGLKPLLTSKGQAICYFIILDKTHCYFIKNNKNFIHLASYTIGNHRAYVYMTHHSSCGITLP